MKIIFRGIVYKPIMYLKMLRCPILLCHVSGNIQSTRCWFMAPLYNWKRKCSGEMLCWSKERHEHESGGCREVQALESWSHQGRFCLVIDLVGKAAHFASHSLPSQSRPIPALNQPFSAFTQSRLSNWQILGDVLCQIDRAFNYGRHSTEHFMEYIREVSCANDGWFDGGRRERRRQNFCVSALCDDDARAAEWQRHDSAASSSAFRTEKYVEGSERAEKMATIRTVKVTVGRFWFLSDFRLWPLHFLRSARAVSYQSFWSLTWNFY